MIVNQLTLVGNQTFLHQARYHFQTKVASVKNSTPHKQFDHTTNISPSGVYVLNYPKSCFQFLNKLQSYCLCQYNPHSKNDACSC